MTIAATYAGVRVLDVSTNLAGPYAAMILGDLGADVVKVERRPDGDDTRSLPPHWGGEATVYLAVNRNKRSVALDLRTGAGRDALMALAERADVVVESFPPGVAERLGLRAADMRARKADLVVASVSAFGDGPLGALTPGYDALVQAVSGMMSFTGHPGTEPVRLAPSVLDLSTGMWAAIGIMAALARRQAGRGGDHVRVALVDTAFAVMCHQVLGYLATGAPPEKLGSGAPSATPYGVYAASDGTVMLATATDAQFERLCAALGMADLARDDRYRTMPDRLAHRHELDADLAAVLRTKTVEVWLARLGAAGISAGAVNDLPAALASPVVAERGLLVEPADYGSAGGLPLLRLPVDPDGSAVRRTPPTFGEHSAEVLAEAGFDPEQIAGLLRDATAGERSAP